MAKNQINADRAGWRGQAIRYLLRHSRATSQIVEHFVEHHWQRDLTNEENLDQFETYRSDMMAVFSF